MHQVKSDNPEGFLNEMSAQIPSQQKFRIENIQRQSSENQINTHCWPEYQECMMLKHSTSTNSRQFYLRISTVWIFRESGEHLYILLYQRHILHFLTSLLNWRITCCFMAYGLLLKLNKCKNCLSKLMESWLFRDTWVSQYSTTMLQI